MPAWLRPMRTTPSDGEADADAADEDLAGIGIEADVVRVARPVCEVGQPACPGDKLVRDAGPGRTRDHVARPNGMLAVRLGAAVREGGTHQTKRAFSLEDDE